MRPIPILRYIPCVLAAAWLLVPGEASSQQVRSPYSFIDTRHEASFLVGSAFESRGQLNLGPGGGPLVGARYGIKLGSAFGFEATGFLISTDRNVFDPDVEAEEDPILLGTTSSTVGGVDARLRFSPTGPRTWRDLAPYAVAGGGLAVDMNRSSSLEEELSAAATFSFGPSFLGTLGAGTRWLPGERLGFRVEAVLHLWKLGTPEAFRALEEQLGTIPDDEWVGVGAILVGASLRF